MTGERLFVVTVAIDADGDCNSLLALASVLNRRGVDVCEADLARPSHGRRLFSATFRAEPRNANTLLKSFEALIDVLGADLFEAFDTRMTAGTAGHLERVAG